jgi:DNA-binding CsgD family transcriptional regulator
VFQCVHALRHAQGCGHSVECKSCTVRALVKKAAQGQLLAREKARLAVQRDLTETELFFEVTAAPLSFEGFRGAVLTMEDIGQRVELERARAELRCFEKELEQGAQELEEAHIALKVLLEKRAEHRIDLERTLQANLKNRVDPHIDQLKQSRLSAAQQEFLRVIEADIAEITSPFIRNLLANNFRLTFREIQIALLVKQGKSTKEIATILKSSTRAIEFHRHNLRQKLGLTGKGLSLESQLARFE